MTSFAKGGRLGLAGKLLDERGKSCILALDVYNILSLELIQTNEWQNDDARILEGTFSRRRQLCVDIQTSNLLKSETLEEAMNTYEVEELPEEFPLALLWDEPPISSAICKMLGKLIGELCVTGINEKYRLHAVSFTLSKGTLAFSATPGQNGNICLNTNSTSLEMRTEDFLRLATQWEIKPDLVFLAKSGPVCFRQLSKQEWNDLESVVNDTESIVLEAPVPSIVMQEQEEGEMGEIGEEEEQVAPEQADDDIQPHPMPEYQWNTWTCYSCGETNEDQNALCRNCGVGRLEAEEPADSAPEPPASFKQRMEAPLREPEEPVSRPKTWKCKHCGKDNPEERTTCEGCRRSNAAGSYVPQAAEEKPAGWECKYCTLINKDSDRICAACAKTRAALLPPSPPSEEERTPRGLWKCEPCGYSANATTDIRCYKCRALKGTKATPQVETQAKAEERWTCEECGEQNNSWSQKCLGCLAPRGGVVVAPPAPEGDTWKCVECKVDNAQRKSYCTKCYAARPRKEPARLDPREDFLEEPRLPSRPSKVVESPKVPEPTKAPEPNQWKCPKCGTANREASRLCSKCVTSRPAREEQGDVDGWTCAKCMTKNRNSDRLCSTCYATKASQQRPAADRTAKPEVEKGANFDSWNCPSCKTLNLSYDPICRRCGSGKELRREPAKEPVLPAKQASDNYWTCQTCNVKNYKGDDKCYRCRKPKETSVIRDSSVEAEPAEDKRWTCEHCQAKNSESATYCMKCISTRSPEKRDTSWTCKFCSRKNTSPGSRCQHCFKRNPDPADDPVSQTKACSQCGKRLFGEGPMCATCEVSSATWRCKKCGQSNKGDSRECKYCVADTETRKKCRTCGKSVVLPGEDYCTACRPRTAKTWSCSSCGTANTGYFCKGCRKPKPI